MALSADLHQKSLLHKHVSLQTHKMICRQQFGVAACKNTGAVATETNS